MFDKAQTVAAFDPEIWASIQNEERRQEDHIELIASENYTSPAVMEAQGTQLTNKYAEGYPGKRYYGGCEHVDVAEALAISRACELFGADYANVQPHSGFSGQQRRLRRTVCTGRYHSGHELGTRWPPDSRFPRQLLR